MRKGDSYRDSKLIWEYVCKRDAILNNNTTHTENSYVCNKSTKNGSRSSNIRSTNGS